jgi:hypothetical protein
VLVLEEAEEEKGDQRVLLRVDGFGDVLDVDSDASANLKSTHR